MPRSQHIWIVEKFVDDDGEEGSVLEGAFTVKHELVSWLGSLEDTSALTVTRMADGRSGVSPAMAAGFTIEELLNPKKKS